MSVLGDLPEGVAAAMFLRDGWPDAVVCKVLMRTGCIGIGIWRASAAIPKLPPQKADEAAMRNAILNVSAEPPDYTEIHEHAAAMKAKAEAAAQPLKTELVEQDDDLQASLGQPAR